MSPGGGGGWRWWCAPVALDSGAEVRCAVQVLRSGVECTVRHRTAPHCSALLRTVLRVVTDGEKAHDGKFDRIEAVDT